MYQRSYSRKLLDKRDWVISVLKPQWNGDRHAKDTPEWADEIYHLNQWQRREPAQTTGERILEEANKSNNRTPPDLEQFCIPLLRSWI